MRVTIIAALLFVSAQFASAQELPESMVPEAVRQTFRSKYPGVYVYEWEYKRKSFTYEAEFTQGGYEYEAHFDADGKWIRTEREAHAAEVPKVVWDKLRAEGFFDYEFDDVELWSTPRHEVVYEIEVKSKGRKFYFYYLPDGTKVDIP